MNPWQNVWAPNVNFPWSGSVAQRIEPQTNWFFDAIGKDAGDGRIEKKAFEIASYGRQLGHITKVVLALAKDRKDLGKEGQASLEALTAIKEAIDEIKVSEASATANDIEDQLNWLKANNEDEYKLLAIRLKSILK